MTPKVKFGEDSINVSVPDLAGQKYEMNMKGIGYRLSKLLFIIGWILIVVIGYKEALFYKGYMYKTLEKGYWYLGEIGNKKIYAVAGYFDDKGGQAFTIKINDELVYTEIYNKDGRVDDTIYCEKGREAYSTHYDPATGALRSRDVEYYRNGLHEFTVFDARLNGDFVTRIKYLDKEKKNFKEAKKIMEIFVNNKWTELKKKNGSYGFYNDAGTFIPIKYDKGKWEIIEAEKEKK